MPLWAVMYIFSLLISALFTIYISKNRSALYIVSEILSALFASVFFFIYYEQLPYPDTLFIPLAMLLFILFQEIWVNRELYDMLSLKHFPKEIHRFMLIAIPLSTITFIAPFVWIVAQVFKHYFLII